MSFILDALKKSEAERQRQAGPTLLEVRITRPRRRYPLWAAIVGALLAVNAVVLVVFVLHRPAAPAAEHGSQTPAVESPTASAGPKAASPIQLRTAGSVAADAAAAGASGGASGAQPAPLATAAGQNPADDEPALPAGSAQVERASASNYANLPSSSQIGGNMPPLRLDLLDYSDHPNERYALINMHRVRAGDVLPEGPRILAITRDGVALNYQGQDFMLRPSAQ